MSFDLGTATNKGTAMMKFAHQFQPDILLKDEYIGWFFDESIAQSLKDDPLNLGGEPTDDVQRFV
ncbi:hypothetical protein [Roseofilum sp. Guam]|uniref:hypothetical protein n=1 Tax=Roseofilum sp. Guam TaxID=2821502 RepID=UPI001B04FD64|nr:hypothetical protein [Roseofilum sp. Guam]MBP0027607.1 hypothetical protein [Roseofilum sp. Guam]